MIEQLITKTFAARNAAHVAHWLTGSYAQHQALGEFYDEVVERTDSLVEIYQGNFGKIKKPKLEDDRREILVILHEQVKWVETNLDEIAQGVKALENGLQDLSALYFRTIYKLENLK